VIGFVKDNMQKFFCQSASDTIRIVLNVVLWSFEFQSCCLKRLQLLCLWYFYVIIQVMNMQ